MVTKKKVFSLVVLGLMSCMMISEVGAKGKHKRKVATSAVQSAPVTAPAK